MLELVSVIVFTSVGSCSVSSTADRLRTCGVDQFAGVKNSDVGLMPRSGLLASVDLHRLRSRSAPYAE